MIETPSYINVHHPNQIGPQADRPTRRLMSLEALRGLAALMVLFAHCLGYNDQPTTRPFWFEAIFIILHHGYLGVPLFFVISGFCIHLGWARKYASIEPSEHILSVGADINFRDFWKRRFRRLYLPYFIVLCTSMALVIFYYFRNTPNNYVADYPQPKVQWMTLDFFAHALMLHGIHPLFDGGGGNRPFWTLAREECFYLLYFPLLFWRRRLGIKNILIIVGFVGFVLPWSAQALLSETMKQSTIGTIVSYNFNTIHSVPLLWLQWCLGMLAVESYVGLVRLPQWCCAPALIPIWLGAAKFAEIYANALRPFLWGMVFFTLINVCVNYEKKGLNVDNRLLKKLGGYLVWLGTFSYSIYLVHNPLITVYTRVFSFTPDGSPSTYLFHVLCLTVVICVTARLFFLLFERRFLNSAPST